MRFSRILAVLVAGVLGSTLIVWAQTTLKPPCANFTDPNCHPAPPVVTIKASQSVTGDVNVTGNVNVTNKVCAGAGTSQRCLGGSSGSSSTTVTTVASTLLDTPIDISSSVPSEGNKALLNVHDLIKTALGIDPGPVSAVMLSAETEFAVSYIYLGSNCGSGQFPGTEIIAAHGDVSSAAVDANHAAFRFIYTPITYVSIYNGTRYECHYAMPTAGGFRIQPANASGQIWLGYYINNVSNYTYTRPAPHLYIIGYY